MKKHTRNTDPMISSIGNVITKLFGKKSDKDVKDISPLVNTILKEQEKLKKISSFEKVGGLE